MGGWNQTHKKAGNTASFFQIEKAIKASDQFLAIHFSVELIFSNTLSEFTLMVLVSLYRFPISSFKDIFRVQATPSLHLT